MIRPVVEAAEERRFLGANLSNLHPRNLHGLDLDRLHVKVRLELRRMEAPVVESHEETRPGIERIHVHPARGEPLVVVAERLVDHRRMAVGEPEDAVVIRDGRAVDVESGDGVEGGNVACAQR